MKNWVITEYTFWKAKRDNPVNDGLVIYIAAIVKGVLCLVEFYISDLKIIFFGLKTGTPWYTW